jgi:hypothetical protein
MEKKTISATEAMAAIKLKMPPGATVRHINSGRLYMMGAKASAKEVWMMDLTERKKGVVLATDILVQFEAVKA